MPNIEPICQSCGKPYLKARFELGYKTCLDCGSPAPIRTVAPAFNKGPLQLITNPNDLKSTHTKEGKL